MNTITTQAFVMNSFPWKDRHRILHLLTPEHGLISALAPATERMRSELRPATQLFALCEFVLTSKQSRYTVRSASLVEPFVAISQDLDRLVAASHAAEVFSDVARHDEPSRTLFELWAYSLYEISVSEEPVFIARMATFRLMVEIGLTPCLDSCVRCHGAICEPYRFSFSEGGLLCAREEFRLTQAELTTLSSSALDLLCHISTAAHKKLYRFYASPETRFEASDFADRWLEERMEKRYNRLELLEQNSTFLFE